MSSESIQSAGLLLVILPTVAFGGVSILYLWVGRDSAYMENALRARMWAAGHAHAGVFLVLSLVALLYVDRADLGDSLKGLVRSLIPASAILVSAAFFLSTLRPDVQKPNALIYLAYLGFVTLSSGLLILGVGLLRA
jgi:hypothetical protein